MGIIDSTRYTLTCQPCDTAETSKVLDKGSNYSGSWWESGADFKHFDTVWSGGDRTEPKLVKATCKACGATPEVKIS
jgi:hypothetical protein